MHAGAFRGYSAHFAGRVFVASDSSHFPENDEFLCDADSLVDVFGISSFCADDLPTLTVQHINGTSASSTTATHDVDLIEGASHEDADTCY